MKAKALKLADEVLAKEYAPRLEIAKELRRLHSENEQLKSREWVGLTDEEVQEIMEKTVATCSELDDFTGYTARLTWKNCEAKLREKNGG
jgi:hypothetical protein